MSTKFIIGAIASLLIVLSTNIANAQFSPDPFCPYPSDGITRYRYFGNCSVFWECFSGVKYILECPEGREFNEDLQECDSPSTANCDPYAPTTANPHPPTYPTTDDDGTVTPWTHDPMCPYPSDGEEVFYPYEGDCTKYWLCSDGVKYEMQCPNHLWWNPQLSTCDFPGDFCDDTTHPTDETTVSTDGTTSSSDGTTHHEVDPRCVDTETDYFPHPEYCHLYIECFKGDSFEMTCPDGLYYTDIEPKGCVPAEDSECCANSSQC